MPSSPTGLHGRPDWSAVPGDSAEDRRLLNQRVAYFGAVMCLLSLAFYLFNLLAQGMIEGPWLETLLDPGGGLHAVATLVFGSIWLSCRKSKRPSSQLNLIDVGGLVVSIGLFAWKGVLEHGGFLQAAVTAMTSLAAIVTHAIIVPATARRTFWVSLLAALPATVAAYFICAELARAAPERTPWLVVLGTAYIALWSGLSVAVATLASRTIYGLRRRAREAREIGQYTLEARIGEGGMGVVYRARHSLLRRPTAIKLLPLELAGENNIRRFEREVQLTSSLTHPNTIAVYDFGRTPEGVFYYVMEYVDGITLQDLVGHGGPLPPARVVHLLMQLCGALVEAHSVGLVHRDIKPANLMLCVRGQVSDHLKVLDFGLVKGRAELGSPSETNATMLLGTPLYMAPEAIVDPSSVGQSADIYAVGAVAYFLLVGEPVFNGSSAVEVCAKHLHATPESVASRAPQNVPVGLSDLVLTCLHKDPRARPVSAAALRAQLASLTGMSEWSAGDADSWWQQTAPPLLHSAQAQHATAPRRPGRQTLAVDWTRRDVAAAGISLR